MIASIRGRAQYPGLDVTQGPRTASADRAPHRSHRGQIRISYKYGYCSIDNTIDRPALICLSSTQTDLLIPRVRQVHTYIACLNNNARVPATQPTNLPVPGQSSSGPLGRQARHGPMGGSQVPRWLHVPHTISETDRMLNLQIPAKWTCRHAHMDISHKDYSKTRAKYFIDALSQSRLVSRGKPQIEVTNPLPNVFLI